MQTTLLRQMRLDKDLLLKDVAKEIGLSVPAVYDLEIGRRKPSLDVLIKILKLYNKSYYKEIVQIFTLVEEKAVANTGMLETAQRKLRE